MLGDGQAGSEALHLPSAPSPTTHEADRHAQKNQLCVLNLWSLLPSNEILRFQNALLCSACHRNTGGPQGH